MRDGCDRLTPASFRDSDHGVLRSAGEPSELGRSSRSLVRWSARVTHEAQPRSDPSVGAHCAFAYGVMDVSRNAPPALVAERMAASEFWCSR